MSACGQAGTAWFSTLIERQDDADSSVEWAINNYCNLRCKHCYMESDVLKERKLFSELEKKMEIAEKIASTSSNVVISGGEPLLDKHIVEVVERLASRGCRVFLATNGTLLSPDMPRRLQKAGLTHAQISVDSADEVDHDEFRGVAGSWAKAMAALQAFQRVGIATSLAHTVHALNYGHLRNIVRLAQERGIPSLYILKFLPCGEGQKNTQYVLSETQEKELVMDIMVPLASETTVELITSAPEWNLLLGKTDSQSIGCAHGRIKFINFNGDLYSCPMVMDKLGSIFEGAMQQENFEKKVTLIRDRSELRGGDCSMCPALQHCGGCYANSASVYGDQFRRGECWVYRSVIGDPEVARQALGNSHPLVKLLEGSQVK